MLDNRPNPLPGVPKVESPFFAGLFDESDSRYQIAKSLHEDGYAIIDFPDPDFDALAERIKQNLHGHYPWPSWYEHGTGMRIQDAWKSNEDVRSLAANRQVTDLLEHLYGRKAYAFQSLNFPVGTEQHFHTDSVHFSVRPERFMCGVWVALEDIGEDQGPLLYYPGSHRWPIYTHEHIGHTYRLGGVYDQSTFEPMWERLVEALDAKPKVFHAKKGQALIWAANLLHGGMPHLDRQKTRWSQVTHYYFDDCVYYTPLMSNEAAGEMYFRQPVDIGTGIAHENSYNGIKLDSGYMAATMPGRLPSGEFNAEAYLRMNPDVAAAGVDPWEHYQAHGRSEGRRW
jgi:hypothetical protein